MVMSFDGLDAVVPLCADSRRVVEPADSSYQDKSATMKIRLFWGARILASPTARRTRELLERGWLRRVD